MKYDEKMIIESLLNTEIPRLKSIDFGTMKIEIVKHEGIVKLLNVGIEEKKKPEAYMSKKTKALNTNKPYRSWKDDSESLPEDSEANYRLNPEYSEGE